jgi:nifR3 family TIM-barrel protein
VTVDPSAIPRIEYLVLSIGGLTLTQPLVLAPLAGISDLAFRLVNRRRGCELAFVEMTSARALAYRNQKTLDMLSSSPEDRPLGVQLLAKDPDYAARALEVMEEGAFDLVDLNAACPVRKVVSNGEGAALMREPRQLAGLVRALVRHAPAPVTVKIRSGWDAGTLNAPEVALRAEEAGASAIFIHGRTRSQLYAGRVDYALIRRVKEALAIPVIASGDVLSPALAGRMFAETGCDAVVLARGALGNPWLFPQTLAYLEGGNVPAGPDPVERAAVMREHLELLVALRGEETAVREFRKFFVWYTRGISGIRAFRELAMHARSAADMEEIIRRALERESQV